MHQTAHMKRFIELMECDPKFRMLAKDDPCRAAADYGLDVREEAARCLSRPIEGGKALPPELAALELYYTEKNAHRSRIASRAENCTDVNFRAWHERQVNRCTLELGQATNQMFSHIPLVLELSSGCSVGCAFCALDAKTLRSVFRFTPENQALFSEVLEAAYDILGESVKDSILYYATEPLDNPDYLSFARLFSKRTGRVPILTTAVPLRNVELTRAAIAMRAGDEPTVNRFSILSLDDLRRIITTFTPEETLYTELLPRYPEASVGMVRAGRGLKENNDGMIFSNQGTVACVSGFIINMAERTLRLSTPCRASEQHPTGEIERSLGRFETARELSLLLKNTCRTMTLLPEREQPISLAPFLKFTPDAPYSIENPGVVRVALGDTIYRCACTLAYEGGKTMETLVEGLMRKGFDATEADICVITLYRRGILREANDKTPED